MDTYTTTASEGHPDSENFPQKWQGSSQQSLAKSGTTKNPRQAKPVNSGSSRRPQYVTSPSSRSVPPLSASGHVIKELTLHRSGGFSSQSPLHETRVHSRPGQQRRSTQARSTSDGGNSLNVRMRQSSLEDNAGARVASQKRSIEMQDPTSSLESSRPAKQAFTESNRQAQNISRHDSVSEELSRTTSPLNHRMASNPQTSSSLAPRQRDSASFVSRQPNHGHSPSTNSSSSEPETTLLKQPATKPISEAQLINEVKGIYAGLVMVEKKCVEIVAQQATSNKRLENQQWKALVALHRTLLQEHHDFFSASQHPTASEALKKLAIKYAMPARMWRHGIHAFLELLRHRLPDSMEHMLSFIYLSYSMMALLKESVPSFVETWIECLGDLARYRMAIEDSDPRDREIWSNVARTWYNEAADKSPNVGRIQHHLAVLARPNIVEQLFYYTKALTTLVPFVNARESIMLLFDMFLKNNEAMQARYPQTESALVHAFALLFTRGSVTAFYALRDQLATSMNGHMDRSGPKLKVQGPQIALALVAGLLDFGKDDSPVWKRCRAQIDQSNIVKQKMLESGSFSAADEITMKNNMQQQAFASLENDSNPERLPDPPSMQDEGSITSSEQAAVLAGIIFSDVTSTMSARIGDKNVVPYMHVALANLWGLSFSPGALVLIEKYVPWVKVATFLNTVGRSGISYCNIEAESFPPSFGAFGRQLPEDFYLRGYITTQSYFPADFFTGQLVDEDERTVELPSHQAPRAERCLWLGVRFASLGRYLNYNFETKQFGVTKTAELLSIV